MGSAAATATGLLRNISQAPGHRSPSMPASMPAQSALAPVGQQRQMVHLVRSRLPTRLSTRSVGEGRQRRPLSRTTVEVLSTLQNVGPNFTITGSSSTSVFSCGLGAGPVQRQTPARAQQQLVVKELMETSEQPAAQSRTEQAPSGTVTLNSTPWRLRQCSEL